MTNSVGSSLGITIKSEREVNLMRQSGVVTNNVKKLLREKIKTGMTTSDIDTIAENQIRSEGAIPAFKGLYGFPATVCASINEEIVHGIPGNRVLLDGDILSIDVGAIVEGYYSDSAFTIGIGSIKQKSADLIKATYDSLRVGIKKVKPGARIGDISSAIQQFAENSGYSVVREYVGHGIGRELHEDPQIPNYGFAGEGPLLHAGMTIAIEPMLNIGGWKTMQKEDGWTVVTSDGSLSAHFEDTILVTDCGFEVLTNEEIN